MYTDQPYVSVSAQEKGERVRLDDAEFDINTTATFHRFIVSPYTENEVELQVGDKHFIVSLALARAIDAMIERARRRGNRF